MPPPEIVGQVRLRSSGFLADFICAGRAGRRGHQRAMRLPFGDSRPTSVAEGAWARF